MKRSSKTRVVVVVVGGNVQDCFSDRPDIEIELIDFDNAAAEGPASVSRSEARVTEVIKQMRHVY